MSITSHLSRQLISILLIHEWHLWVSSLLPVYFIMVKTKELSSDMRSRIIAKHREGHSIREIGKLLIIPKSSVCNIIKKWKMFRTTANKQRSGAPRKLNERTRRTIVRAINKDPRITATALTKELAEVDSVKVHPETVRRALRSFGLNGRVARKKPLLKQRHKTVRLNFARKHITKPQTFWNNVLWSDETKIKRFESDGKVWVWRKPGEAFKDKYLVPTVKHGGGGVMVWGCMASSGVGAVHFIDGIMDRKRYSGEEDAAISQESGGTKMGFPT